MTADDHLGEQFEGVNPYRTVHKDHLQKMFNDVEAEMDNIASSSKPDNARHAHLQIKHKQINEALRLPRWDK